MLDDKDEFSRPVFRLDGIGKMLDDCDEFKRDLEFDSVNLSFWVRDLVNGRLFPELTRRKRLILIRDFMVYQSPLLDVWLKERSIYA